MSSDGGWSTRREHDYELAIGFSRLLQPRLFRGRYHIGVAPVANFVLDAIVNARRVRDAVRQIRSIPTTDRDRKNLLAAWFQEHTGAARDAEGNRDRAQYHAAYNDLLGRDGNSRLMG
jgi:hypothetical protein